MLCSNIHYEKPICMSSTERQTDEQTDMHQNSFKQMNQRGFSHDNVAMRTQGQLPSQRKGKQ